VALPSGVVAGAEAPQVARVEPSRWVDDDGHYVIHQVGRHTAHALLVHVLAHGVRGQVAIPQRTPLSVVSSLCCRGTTQVEAAPCLALAFATFG
jgi:hypothetical protein